MTDSTQNFKQKSMSKSEFRLHKIVTHLRSQNVANASLTSTQVLSSGIAVLQLNNKPANALSPVMISALHDAYNDLISNSSVKGIIITGNGRFFCGGADIGYLSKITNGEMDRDVGMEYFNNAHRLLNKIEGSNIPVIAAVNGYALGGGCELALSCHYRVATPTVNIGLVEATLGLIPGFGGTQRLPRLVGMEYAFDTIIYGKSYKAATAKNMGLIDEIVTQDQLIQYCESVCMQYINGEKAIERTLYKTDKIYDMDYANKYLTANKHRIESLVTTNPGVLYGIRAILGVYNGPNNGLKVELKEFNEIIHTVYAKAQIYIFFAQRKTHKVKGKMSKNIRNIGVVNDNATFKYINKKGFTAIKIDSDTCGDIPKCDMIINKNGMYLDKIKQNNRNSSCVLVGNKPGFVNITILKKCVAINKNNCDDNMVNAMIKFSKKLSKICVILNDESSRLFKPYIFGYQLLLKHGIQSSKINGILADFGMRYTVDEISAMIGNPTFNIQTKTNASISDNEILPIMLYGIINESYKMIRNNIASKLSDIDVLSIFGYGFPIKYGGIHFYGKDIIGLNNIKSILSNLSNKFGYISQAKLFFNPCLF